MHDIAAFLKAHDPFSGLDEEALERLADNAQVESFAAGTIVFEQGERPQTNVRVVRRGAVELVDGGRVVDVLGEGEVFGHPSMLSGLPTGFQARAREDLLCFVLDAADVLPLLARPRSLRYLTRSLLRRRKAGVSDEAEDVSPEVAARQPAHALIRSQPLICGPETPVRHAAEQMVQKGASSALVRGGDGTLGIVTERDLGSRVVGRGVPTDAPVREVMTTPVVTVSAEQSGADVMLAMLDNDVRHVPVLSPRSEILGVIAGIDLVAAEAHTPFLLRRAIAEANTKEQLKHAAARLRSTVVALHRSDCAPAQISRVISVVGDALIRRMIELAIKSTGGPPTEFVWLALGSHGRREPVPSSDVDSGMAWREVPDADAVESETTLSTAAQTNDYMHAIAAEVADCLDVVGWRVDAHGVTAADEFAAASIGEWRAGIQRWLEHPDDNRVLIATSILLDGRVVYGPEELNPRPLLHDTRHRAALLRWMLRLALAARPPTGFMRDFVIEHSGEHRGTLDIKHGGLLPVLDLARYGALKAEADVTSTVERLRAAGDAGALDPAHARTLTEAYGFFAALRLDHQVGQLEQGAEPDEQIDPKQLNSLTRRFLRDAFREVAAVQKSLAGRLTWAT